MDLGVSIRAAKHNRCRNRTLVRSPLGQVLEELVIEAASWVLEACSKTIIPNQTGLEEDQANQLRTGEAVLAPKFLGYRETKNRSQGLVAIVFGLHTPIFLQEKLQGMDSIMLQFASPVRRRLDLVIAAFSWATEVSRR